MTRRLPLSLVLAAAFLFVAAPRAGAGSAVLGVRADPGAHSGTTVLHPPARVPSRVHGPRIAALAAASKRPAALPTITKVTPLKLAIGAKLTITGRNFIPGKRRNTVVFLRNGAPAIFLKADKATSTRLTVTITAKLGRFLIDRNNGQKAATRFQLRVLARRFGARFTPKKLSPTISPASGKDGSGSAPTCTNAIAKANPTLDADGDGLLNALELTIKTDPCNPDTDGDTISDGYEYQASLDLNSRALPFPGKRPYPNALDPSDPGTDYDSDGLTLLDEYTAWVQYGGKRFPLTYSDGTQTTGGPVPVDPFSWQDLNHNGVLTDDEKDVDGDGLTNWDEAHGRMQPAWWGAIFTDEKPYPLPFLGTDWLDRDTDGDGLPDGPDDVDHDGWANQDDITRGPYWLQPFNPCLPDPYSLVCALHPPPPDAAYPPFSPPGIQPGEPIPLLWPRS